jgi:hypothetical protein
MNTCIRYSYLRVVNVAVYRQLSLAGLREDEHPQPWDRATGTD